MRRKALVVALLVVPAIAFAGFRASSFKKETRLGANYWNAASALDGKLETCWMVDPESENIGEWIEIDLPASEVDKLAMVVGWEKDAATFKDYARVKAVRVEAFGSAEDENARVLEHTITFEDKPGWQILDLPDTKVGSDMHGGRLRVTVTETYAGDDYPTIGVSEVLVHLKEGDVPGTAIKWKSEPSNSASGKDVGMMTDGNAKTFWQGTGGNAEFEIAGEGFGVSSFVLAQGPATSARPKTIEVTANEISKTVTLDDKPGVAQSVLLPAVVGYTGSIWGGVRVKVVDTYPGKTDQNVAITEVGLKQTNYEGL